MSSTHVDTKTARRRMVSFASLADVSKDLDKLEVSHQAGTLHRLGNHEAGPIFGHLAIAIRGSFEGIPPMGPLWLRMVGPMFKNRVLNKPLGPGVRYKGADERAAWDDTISMEKGLASLREQVARLAKPDAAPTARHPILGKLTAAEWRTFHLRHAELHLSFLQIEGMGRAEAK